MRKFIPYSFVCRYNVVSAIISIVIRIAIAVSSCFAVKLSFSLEIYHHCHHFGAKSFAMLPMQWLLVDFSEDLRILIQILIFSINFSCVQNIARQQHSTGETRSCRSSFFASHTDLYSFFFVSRELLKTIVGSVGTIVQDYSILERPITLPSFLKN